MTRLHPGNKLWAFVAAGAVFAAAAGPALAKKNNPEDLSKGEMKELKAEYKSEKDKAAAEQAPRVKMTGDQKFENRLRDLLDADDSEWSVLQPKVQKIMTLQRQVRDTRTASLLTSSSRSNNNPDSNKGKSSKSERFYSLPNGGLKPGAEFSGELQERARALRDTWADDTATPQEVKSRLDQLRETRLRVLNELMDAQSDLREIVTVRQEVVLVMMGVLD